MDSYAGMNPVSLSKPILDTDRTGNGFSHPSLEQQINSNYRQPRYNSSGEAVYVVGAQLSDTHGDILDTK